MKRVFAYLLSAALLLSLLPACNQQAGATPTNLAESEPAAPDASAPPELELGCALIVFTMWGALDIEVPETDLLLNTLGEDGAAERMAAYIEGAYGLAAGEWEDGSIIRAAGASAVELAVLRFTDEDGAKHGEDCLKDYLHAREGDFTGYAPDQAKLVADGALCRQGRYVGLFIWEDSALAESTFIDIIRTGELPAPVEPSPTSEPAPEQFPIHDLLFRLLIETVCPDWASIGKAWSDFKDSPGFAEDMESTHGISITQYETFAFAEWIPGSARDDHPFNHFPHLGADYELIVFLAEDEAGAAALVEPLNDYLKEKEARLRQEGREYAADLVAGGQVAQSGRYTMLVVSDYADEAVMLFPRAVNDGATEGYFQRYIQGVPYPPEPTPVPDPDSDYPDRVKFTQPNKDDMSLYDTSAIRAAWASGDPSALSEYDRETYDAAQAILGEILTDGMTDLEKESAIYYWLVNHVDYDWRHQDILAVTPRSSYEPHGGLVDYTAVCLGYATSFQLLMDLAGVECITVVGAAFRSEEDHGWNMVRLNGNWYCVDVTWDANGREQLGPGEPEDWRYFNITSNRMAETNHQWDYSSIPEARAEDHGQG